MLDNLIKEDRTINCNLKEMQNLGYFYQSKNINEAREKLLQTRQIIIQENLSKNKKDLENLVIYFSNKLNSKKDDVDLTIGLGNCLEKLQKTKHLKSLFSNFDKNVIGSYFIKKRLADIFYKEGNFKSGVQPN